MREKTDGRSCGRLMLAAPASGSGKTMISCGIMTLLKRKMKTAAFKCGPDYIDPMYHSRFLGIPSRNLDTFFTDSEMTGYLMQKGIRQSGAEIAVVEGVMGFYDGLGGTGPQGSSYDLARVTGTPVVLIINARGMSLSLLALIKGFLDFREDNQIRGVILNRCSAMVFQRLAPLIESELGIAALGYVPETAPIRLPSRHLGLVLPSEMPELEAAMDQLADLLESCLDMDRLLAIAAGAKDLAPLAEKRGQEAAAGESGKELRLAVAMDEAFCFYYEDNLDLLREKGAQIVFFSPLREHQLPENIQGIYIGGGYPELHGQALEDNQEMQAALKAAAEAGMPVLAECGGFMYLHEQMEDADGILRKMCGLVPGDCLKKDKLVRFGYSLLEAEKKTLLGEAGFVMPAHEFHYWDSSRNGDCFRAKKPGSSRTWQCMYSNEKGNLLAGFPHLYFYSKPEMADHFLEACRAFAHL